jgi:tight adherence protein B
MNRRVLGLSAVVAALACAASASAASAPIRITEAGGASFPGRSYVLSLPRAMQLAPGVVSVTENGQDVDSLLVTSAGGDTSTSTSPSQKFGVVLAIDASISMRGNAIKAAMSAARTLAAQRNVNQLFGLIVFNQQPSVALPLTSDPATIDQALQKPPPLAPGTRIYDAVDTAVGMLEKAHIQAGSVVVLSDGADTGSQNTESQAAVHARNAHIRVFTVGLKSRFFQGAPLKKLAHDVGGSYIVAQNAGALTGIYGTLGSKFANEYLIQYRSLAKAGIRVDVRVKVKGVPGVAASAYDTPKLAVLVRAPKGPYKISVSHRLWSSTITAMIAALLAAGLVGIGAYSLVAGPSRGTVRRRMAEFVSVPLVGRDRARPTAALTGKVLDGTESLLRGTTSWHKFKWELQVAQVKMPPEQIIVLTLLASLMSFLFVEYFFGSLIVAIIFALVIPFGARSLIKRDLAKKRAQFGEQLPDNLQVLASALRAGHSFIGALSVVVNDAPEPARSEFQRVIADEQLGVPVDEALRVVVERMDNRELEQVALVAAMQRESGGNTAEVLDRVTETIRERFELRRTVKTLTAQGRMSRWVLTALPLSLFAFISLVNPTYMHVLTSSTVGKVLLVMAGISVTAGSLVIKRIVNIKV